MRLPFAMSLLMLGLALPARSWAGKGAEIAVVGAHVTGQTDDAALQNAAALTEAIEGAESVMAEST